MPHVISCYFSCYFLKLTNIPTLCSNKHVKFIQFLSMSVRLINLTTNFYRDRLYAGTVKPNVRKRHVAIDTGVKQTERTIFLMLFQWDKNCNCFQAFLKVVSKFGKSYLRRLNIPMLPVISVLLNHSAVTDVDQICRWSTMDFSLVTHTHRRYLPIWTIIRFMLGLVWLEPISTCWRDTTSSLYQRIVTQVYSTKWVKYTVILAYIILFY